MKLHFPTSTASDFKLSSALCSNKILLLSVFTGMILSSFASEEALLILSLLIMEYFYSVVFSGYSNSIKFLISSSVNLNDSEQHLIGFSKDLVSSFNSSC